MSLWQQLFGESQREAWGRLAIELGATFEPGGFLGTTTVRARLGGYDLVLDSYTVSTGKSSQVYTRLRAPFVNPRGLRFRIHRASMFTGLAKALGKQDIDIGVPDFDRDFVIQGNDEERVRGLLSDPALRALFAAQPRVMVQIVDNDGIFGTSCGDDVDILEFVEGGLIKDVARLRGLFAIFPALLRALNQDPHSFLEVAPAELPAVFMRAIDTVAESLGGDAERVQETVEARIPNPLGLVGGARCVLHLPTLPELRTSFTFAAPIPPSDQTFTVARRGLLERGLTKCGDDVVDDVLAIRGASGARQAYVRALRTMVPSAPDVAAGAEELTVRVPALPADRAPALFGATLDLWVELCRARAGEEDR